MTISHPQPRPLSVVDRFILTLLALGLLAVLLTGCSRTPKVQPVPPAVEVKVPVPVPCVPVQVPAPAEPKAEKGMGIFDLTKVALAKLSIKTGDNERLRAANQNPCPGAPNAVSN